MIVVTGANGQLGRLVVEKLLDRVPAEEVGVSVRDPEGARDLADRGVRVRQGDFADPAGLPHAFEGASRVLLISVNALGDDKVRWQRDAAAAARAAGAERVLYTSHMGASDSSPFPPMRDHAATESQLLDAGLPFTSLRNGFYASTVARIAQGALHTGVLAVPEDGPVAWTTHADLAEGIAVALADDRLDGLSPPLTAGEAPDMAAVARSLSEVTGRPIRHEVVSDDDYRATMVDHGAPEAAADMMVGLFAAGRRGDFAQVDPTLGELIGHPPTPLRDALTELLADEAAR